MLALLLFCSPLDLDAARARDGLRAANAASSARWASGSSGPRVAGLRRSLGFVAADRPDGLALKTRRTLEREGFSLAFLTFRSRFGATVTAHLYAPSKARARMPGLLLVHSHHAPKSEGELQDMGAMWARAGCLVLVPDLLGHGERRQHPFATAKDHPRPFRASRQDYWFRHVVGMQLEAAGGSLMGWMAADLHACVSVLLRQPGIDKERLAVLGAVAGGGDPAAVIAALDERLEGAVVFNFGGPQPESRYPLPDNAEKSFGYAGGGSWEPTRNLALSARDGFLPWEVVAGIAPRRLVYAHEFSWDEKRDPVWKRLKEVWKDAPGNLRSAHGFGTLTGKGEGAGSHCTNIGAVHRKGIHAAFKDWWGIEAEEPKERKRLPAADLRCLEDREGTVPVRELALKRLTPVADVRAWWKEALGVGPVEPSSAGMKLLRPEEEGKRPVTVLFGQGGTKELLAKRKDEIAALVAQGEAVAVLDLGGTADLPPGKRGRGSASTAVASSFQMLGRPLLGERLRTLRAALASLRKDERLDARKIRLWGDSTQEAGSGGVVPLDLEQPPHSEPVGPHLALVAALFEDVAEVRARGGLASWASLLDGPAVHFPYDGIVPGAARADWPAVCAAIKCPVRLEGLVDGTNRRVPLAEARKRHAASRHVTVAD
ncbi:MAG: acetylxylan esterase [Gemmataceae bacterium]|nr:acetylxylan esterase [Gemmataceae bacterium]